jgi:hypothetical protein
VKVRFCGCSDVRAVAAGGASGAGGSTGTEAGPLELGFGFSTGSGDDTTAASCRTNRSDLSERGGGVLEGLGPRRLNQDNISDEPHQVQAPGLILK